MHSSEIKDTDITRRSDCAVVHYQNQMKIDVSLWLEYGVKYTWSNSHGGWEICCFYRLTDNYITHEDICTSLHSVLMTSMLGKEITPQMEITPTHTYLGEQCITHLNFTKISPVMICIYTILWNKIGIAIYSKVHILHKLKRLVLVSIQY